MWETGKNEYTYVVTLTCCLHVFKLIAKKCFEHSNMKEEVSKTKAMVDFFPALISLPTDLPQIQDSKVTSDGRSKAIRVKGPIQENYLTLIDSSDQCVVC